jgi:hypothetical protein
MVVTPLLQHLLVLPLLLHLLALSFQGLAARAQGERVTWVQVPLQGRKMRAHG